MRRLLLISLMVLPLVLDLGGCASAVSSGYGQGGQDARGRDYAEARADNKLRAAVISALVNDREVPAMDITVAALHGVVTLSGRVPSAAAVRRAGRVAAMVSGVVRVDNRLNVAP